MLSLILAAALTPTAQANLTSYYKLQVMIGGCSAYIDALDRAAFAAELRTMPSQVVEDGNDLLWKGLANPLSYEVCVKHMPNVLLKANAVLHYPLLDKPSEGDMVAALVNERFGDD